jgi:hypothetical protein
VESKAAMDEKLLRHSGNKLSRFEIEKTLAVNDLYIEAI